MKIITKTVRRIGEYFMMLGEVLRVPQRGNVFRKQYFREIYDLGYNSFGIVAFLSFFVGAVVSIQMALNLSNNAFIPKYYIAYATRESIVLEFAPTIISIILVGKVGSYIASSIGTMRVTEQIEALDVMGVNSLNYLVLPKIVAALTFFPILIMSSMVIGMIGGWVAAITSGSSTTTEYVTGLQVWFDPFYITYAMIKSEVFAFVIVTIPSYYGYYIKGGALDVGRASTNAVVWSSVTVIILNYILTQLILG